MPKGAGHSDDVHCTGDFLNGQQSSHAYRINTKRVIDHVMFPWEGKPEFPDAVCYITGIFEQQWRGQTSMLSLLDLSAAAAPTGHGCLWYVCCCLCEGPELHDWLDFFLLSAKTQMAVLGDRSRALRGVSLCLSPNSSILSFLLFSQRKQFQGLHNPLQKGEHCPACLVYLPPGPVTPVQNVERLRNCQLTDLRAANSRQEYVGMPQ